ncbi:MAG: hypothetical protein A3F90_13895 [Deltaproteobacteria bacterium RIFCSPLOWO2_12_FULL_60_19]|nr:MAG: hypothetical protein A3F90_13895 [Deltaproteobacteria bacterium RIFCSPLOWO2_12_FULL_60_19]
MKQGLKELSPFLCLAVASVLSFASALPAAQPAPRVDPVQANRDARQATQNLDRDVNAGLNNLQRLTRDANNLEAQLKRAKGLADKAAKAASDAFDAASKCDKARFDRVSKQARDLANQAEKEKQGAEEAESRLNKNVKETMEKVNKRASDVQDTINQGVKAAKEAGFADNSVAMGNLRDAQAMLDREIAKQNSEGTKDKKFEDEGSLHRLNKAQDQFNSRLREIKEGNDLGDSLKRVEQLINDGAALLAKNCPPKVGAVPRTATDMYAFANNRQEVLACIAPGQNPQEAANALGMATHQFVAGGPGGTMIRGPGDPQTVNRLAQDRKVTLCFPAEADVCIIMTPLTPFRGHDHQAHSHSGRGVHDHEGSDPPLDWGVTPPQTVIRWEER